MQKTLEELAELQVAIAHEDKKENVLEELADVLVMAEQVRLMWSINEGELDRMIDYKVDRTLERMSNDEV
jgi:NTP pyrophosphatase (non-canonical NTP hydrolase)